MSQRSNKQKPHRVAGLFLERTGGFLLKAMASPAEEDGWHLEYEEEQKIEWHSDDPADALAGLDLFGKILSDYRSEISSFAIASYGPFLSLTPGKGYGIVRRDTADPPLNGFDPYDFFGLRLGNDWLSRDDTRFQVQTDACACAVGEAYLRGIGKDEVLAYLFVTEGVGIGLARGHKIVGSALHPEIGLLPAYVHPDDPVATKEGKRAIPLNRESALDFHSISRLSKNSALRDRYTSMKKHGDNAYRFTNKRKEKLFWDIRACYLAQACIACTVVSPPHAIVVGADIDPLGDVAQRIWHYFEVFSRGWKMSGAPLFEYKELAEGFISRPSSVLDQHHPEPAVTGAVGLCQLAAAASADKKSEDPSHLHGAFQ